MRIFIGIHLAAAIPVSAFSTKLLASLVPAQPVFTIVVAGALTFLVTSLVYMALKVMAETFHDIAQVESD